MERVEKADEKRLKRIRKRKVGDRIIGTKLEFTPGIFEVNCKYQIIGEIIKWNEDKSRAFVRVIQTYENDTPKYITREGNQIYIARNPHFWMDPCYDTDGWEWDVF